MATAHTTNTGAKRWARASIVNSLLLPATAALQFGVTFWVLVVTNFVLMHAVWISQIRHFRDWRKLDFRPFFWSLVSFAVLGNLSLLLWGEQLLGVFPTYSH
jgi:hypothetical protein